MSKKSKSKKAKAETVEAADLLIGNNVIIEKSIAKKAESAKPQSFRSLRAAKKYAKENGGKVIEKGRFYVR
tara:strand:+ start:415 stop:627 length:213 start_codon:yes stop_codon:yes gene_type:complete